MLSQIMLPTSLTNSGAAVRTTAATVERNTYQEQAAARREAREQEEVQSRLVQARAIIQEMRKVVFANDALVAELAGTITPGVLNEEMMFFEEKLIEMAKLHKGRVNFRPFLDVLDILLTWEPNADTFALVLDFIRTRIMPVAAAEGDWGQLFLLANSVPGQGSNPALQPLYAKLKVEMHRVMLDEPNDDGLVKQFTQLREIAEEVGKTFLERNSVDLGAAAKDVSEAQAGAAKQ